MKAMWMRGASGADDVEVTLTGHWGSGIVFAQEPGWIFADDLHGVDDEARGVIAAALAAQRLSLDLVRADG